MKSLRSGSGPWRGGNSHRVGVTRCAHRRIRSNLSCPETPGTLIPTLAFIVSDKEPVVVRCAWLEAAKCETIDALRDVSLWSGMLPGSVHAE